MQVFILAAGKSTRLSGVGGGMAKPLLKINSRPILEYLVKIVSSHPKTEEIHIIVGYRKEDFLAAFGNSYNNVPIKYHYNPEYASSDNLFSLYCARGSMKDDIMFMTADLVIDPEIVHKFLDEEPGNRVLVDPRKEVLFSDVVKVKIKDSKIAEMSKNLDPEDADAAAVGLYRMDKEGKKSLFSEAERIFAARGKKVWIIDPIPGLIGSSPFYASVYSGYLWFDIDEPEDLAKAEKEIPKLYKSLWHT